MRRFTLVRGKIEIEKVKETAGAADVAISKNEVSIARHGFFEQTHGLSKRTSRIRVVKITIDHISSLKKKVVGSQVLRRRRFDTRFFLSGELRLKTADDCFGDVTLNTENIRQIAIVLFAPNGCVGAG